VKKLSLILVLYFFTLIHVSSQEMQFKHISVEDGLPSNNIQSILQDSDGFFWFGTKDGLCRYDGYSFLNFTQSRFDSLSLSNNHITSIIEDKNKNLWIGTYNGLNMLDRETYQIKRMNSIFNDSTGTFHINSLMVSEDDLLWICTNNSGLYSLDININKLSSYLHSEQDSTTIVDNCVYDIIENRNKGLLVGTKKGLDLLDQNTHLFSRILKNREVRSLVFYPDSSVFIGGITLENYYYKLDSNNVLYKIQLLESIPSKQIKSLIDSDGNQWMSLSDNGLIYTDVNNKKHRLLFDKSNSDGISSNSINTFFEDRLGNIWIGTEDAGINVHEKISRGFIHIKDNYLSNGLQNNRVGSIYQDSEGDIWIGTKMNGKLSKFDRETLTFTHYRINASDDTSINNDFIYSITEDKPGFLWIGTQNGLYHFDKSTGNAKAFFSHHKKQGGINPNTIFALLNDGDSLYIGYNNGLDIYDAKRKTYMFYDSATGSKGLSNNKINVIYKDSKDNIWVGTMHGLNLYNKGTGGFRHYLNDPDNPNSISENNIQSIHEDGNHNLWIGTKRGINLMDRDANSFKSYDVEDGLPGNSVYGILDDNNGNLWISTNNGLSKFNPKTITFKNYNIYDGLQANEFSGSVYCKTKNGEMLFGGNNGFNIFNPDNITQNSEIPSVFIIGFKLANKEVQVNSTNSPLKKHITQSEGITLTYKQSVMTFEYVALNYTTSKNIQYAYMMEGFEDQWNYVGVKREATYTNLDPGDYVFRVKASNNDGLWNEEGVSIKIKKLPPPWRTWLAYVIYFILFLGLLFLFWIYTTKRAKEEKRHEQDEMKLRFFINVSHEFRTPLTLIQNPVEKILLNINDPEVIKSSVSTIKRSTSRLLNLTNQLLDLRKLDMKRDSLSLVEADIISFINTIFLLYENLAISKNINFSFKSNQKKFIVLFDPDKIEKIVTNLVTNALKFTDSGGSVTLSIFKITQKIKLQRKRVNEFLEIRVQDTGIGLKEEQLKEVFSRFFHVDNTKAGTGIGLNLTKNIVDLCGGEIMVESKYMEGSTFIVHLPTELRSRKVSSDILKSQQINEYKFNIDALASSEYSVSVADNKISTESKDFNKTSINRENKPVLLIVEDNTELRIHLKNELSDCFNIIEANDGSKGIAMVHSYYPDIIISDVVMPEMDGFEMCRKIKSEIDTCHVPIILLTRKSLEEDKILGFDTGADDYLPKPFMINVLRARLKNLLEMRRRLREKFLTLNGVRSYNDLVTSSLDEAFLDKTTNIIMKNIDNSDFGVENILKKLGISYSQFYRKISALSGQNPSKFIRVIHLKYSTKLLLENKYSIKEIAYMSGFSSTAYYSKTFRELYGITPTQFIEKNVNSDKKRV